MRENRTSWLVLAALLGLGLAAQLPAANDDDKAAPAAGTIAEDGGATSRETYRASTLVGMKVLNPAGDELGKVEDLVIDVGSGRVRYAALSFGGFLGIGDKLFAVPMHALNLQHKEDDSYLVLDADQQRLEKAPGFNADAWPDFANPNWGADVDAFYGASTDADHPAAGTHEGKVVRVEGDELTMTDETGSREHKHTVGPDVRITLDGRAIKLNGLRKGHLVSVTTDERDGTHVVVAIEGRTAARKSAN
jgi:sporulation protein YlmC with PRC-barrel domain